MLDIVQNMGVEIFEVFKSSYDYIDLHDEMGNILDVNNTTLQNLGYSYEEILQMNISDLVVNVDSHELNTLTTKSFKTGIAGKPRIVKLRKKNGNFIYIKGTTTPITKNGKTHAILGIGHDISDSIKADQKLKELEEKFNVLFYNSKRGIAFHKVIYDSKNEPINYVIIDVNPQYEKILNLQKKDVLNKTATEVYQVKKAPYIEIYSKVAKTSESISFETFFPPLKKYFSISVISPRKGEFITIFDNITERKKAEQKLKSEVDKFEGVINGLTIAGIGIDIVDLDYNILFQNQLLKDRFGVSPKNCCYTEYMDLTEPCEFCPMVKAVKTGKVERVELKAADKRFYELISAPLPDQDSNINKAIEIVIDITDRKNVEEELIKEKKFTEVALDAQRDTFFIFEPSIGKAIRWNKAFSEISGYNDEEIETLKAPDSYYDESDLKRTAAATKKIIEEGAALLEIDLITKDGTKIPFEYLGSSINDDEGNLKYIVSIGRDITEHKKIEQELRNSEEKFRTIAEQSVVGISIIQDNQFKYINQHLLDLIGYTREEVENWEPGYFINLIHPDFQERIIEVTKKNQSGEAKIATHEDVKVINKNGKIIWVELFAHSSIFQGRSAGMNITLDITERKKAEQKLKESEEKWRALSENSPAHIMLLDREHKIIFINRTVPDLSKEEVIGTSVYTFMPLEFHQVARDSFNSVWKTSEPATYFTNYITKEGEIRFFDVWIGPVFQSGKIIALVSHSMDKTENKEAEQKLKESEEKYRDLLNNIHEVVFELDENGRMEYISPQVYKLTGYLPEEQIDIDFRDLIHPDDIESVLIDFKRIMQTGETHSADFRRKHKDGHYVYVNSTGRRAKIGDKYKLIGTSKDITERIEAERKLKESEEKFRNITEQSLMGIGILQDNVVKYASQRLAEIYGYSVEEMLNFEPFGFLKLIHPDFVELVKEQADKKQLGKENAKTHYYVKIVRKSGEEVWVENYSKTINFDGKPADLVTNIDITERKKAEKKLTESEEKYKAILDSIVDGVWVTNKDDIIYYTNKSMEKIAGIPTEQIVNSRVLVDFSESTLEYFKPYYLKAKNSLKEVFYDSIPIETPAGRQSFQSGWLIPIEKEGKYNGIICTVEDVTERKKAEEKILYQAKLVENVSEAIISTDLDFNIVSWNIGAEKIYGWKAEEAIGKNVMDIIRVEYPNDDQDTVIKELFEKGFWAGEVIQPRKSSIHIDVFSSVSLIKNANGQPIGAVANNRDITEKKEAERLIMEENVKLMELSQMRQDLITRISHELKTPLTSIYGVSQVFLMIPKEELNEEISEYIQISHRGCIRLRELIDNLLDASRLDAKKFILKTHKENLIELIEECISDMTYLQNSRKHAITSDLPKELFFEVDKLRLSQAIINLISNAIKNTPMQGKILISANDTINYIDIQVRDTGVGLTEKEKERLFQKFGKIERYGKELEVDIEGAGLGLFISKEIVELHGGQILVESEGRNKGATFIIRLFKNL